MAIPRDAIGFLTLTTERGGAEAHTAAVARGLVSRGRRVVVLQLGHAMYEGIEDPESPNGLQVATVGLPAPLRELPVAFWRGLVSRYRLDTVVLVKGAFGIRWPSLDLALLGRRTRYLRIEHSLPPEPEVLTSRRHLGGLVPGVGLWYWRHRALLALHRAATDHVISVSHAIKHPLVTEYRYQVDEVSVVHNGIDSARYRADPVAAVHARGPWGLPSSAFVFGTVCRLAKAKRLDQLLAAFRLVLESSARGCFLVLVGAGSEEASLRALAEQLGVAERCIWAGASPSPWLEYPGFDCFALTSELEGLPYALLEAMSCECVPIAMAIPGIQEVVTEGITGRLVTEDVPAFAGAMREVMSYPRERRAEMGGRARRHVLDHHQERSQVEKACSVILGSNGRPAA